MRLLSMKLENFQGIKNLTLNFNGLDKTIKGDNATGKTTIANAQSWLLTGKSSEDEKNYSPKTENSHGLEHSVECSYDLENGVVITLKKVLKEKYTKKRGSTTAEFSGHEVLHYVDGVPVKEKEYQQNMQEICGQLETVQMLTNVSYFSKTMKWDKRRALLMEMCGNYSDDYIIAANPELIDLKAVLLKPGNSNQYYTVEEYMKLTRDRMRKINTEIQAVPARIDEANRAIPVIDSLGSKESIQNLIQSYNKDLESLNNEKAKLEAGNTAEQKKQDMINDINVKMKQGRIDHQTSYSTKNNELQNEINAISAEVNKLRNDISSKDRSISSSKKDLGYMKQRRNELLTEYKEVQALQWDSSKEICPTCGQELPQEKIEELKKKFNLNKSNRLEEINKKGQAVSKDAIKEVEELIIKLEKDRETLGTDLILKNNNIQELENMRPKLIPFEDTEEYRVLKEQLDKTYLMSSDDSNKEAKQIINQKIETSQKALKSLQEDLSKYDIKDFQLKRINTLKDMQRTLSADYEKLEATIYLCESFIKAKVNMVTEKINERFRNVSFKLFDVQVNGGLKECCEIMIPSPSGVDVPYASANNAAKINAGLEVIKTLQDHYEVKLPVFVDNAESVTQLNEMDSQVIRLVVDENYKTLTMED